MLLESESSVKVSAGIHAFRRLSLSGENLGGDSWGRIGCLSVLSQFWGAPDALWLVATSLQSLPLPSGYLLPCASPSHLPLHPSYKDASDGFEHLLDNLESSPPVDILSFIISQHFMSDHIHKLQELGRVYLREGETFFCLSHLLLGEFLCFSFPET